MAYRERFIHVAVAARRERFRERAVVRFLAFEKAEIFQKNDACIRRGYGFPLGAHAVFRDEINRRTEPFCEKRRERRE